MSPLFALAAIALGAALLPFPRVAPYADSIWLVGLVATGVPVVVRTLQGAAKLEFAADLVASLAIVTALILNQPFVGLVIVLMQTGGESLERFARRKATAALRELENAAPRAANRIVGSVTERVRADDLAIGDMILVRPGELVPCDSEVTEGMSHVDVSALTGEPVPVSASPGTRLMSGSQNLDGPLEMRATAIASESQYARIVELVRSASASKAPLQRVADKYAIWFTPITLAVCVIAYAGSGDALRVLAVLAVATPCPLILATPVAILGGIDRAARRQIIVRDGGALERLERVTVAVLDKTGTLTIGMPRVSRVLTLQPFSEAEVLRLASGVEHGSGHLLARTLVSEALARGISVPSATRVIETAGRGVEGVVEDHAVLVGSRSLARDRYPSASAEIDNSTDGAGSLHAYVVVDGVLAGTVEYADTIRPQAAESVAALRALGARRVLLLSGDRSETAVAVGAATGITETRGDLLAEDKVRAVRDLEQAGERVLAVGDGTNDAPALRAATIGIALAGHGGGITAEAADVVILTDDISRVPESIAIGRRTMRIARQSIRVGLGLSAVGMAAAAAGYLTPTAGALLQEGIDIAVIINALRARVDG